MKILCVDDEPLALKMLEMSVKKAKPDAEVSAFRKPRELLEAAQQGGCDIAFLDIHMRGMNGVELAKELKTVNPRLYHEARQSGKGRKGACRPAFSDRAEEKRQAAGAVLRQL